MYFYILYNSKFDMFCRQLCAASRRKESSLSRSDMGQQLCKENTENVGEAGTSFSYDLSAQPSISFTREIWPHC